jgi:cytochrome P450
MVWMLWFLATNPTSQERLLEELQQEVGGECGNKLKAYALRNDR